MNRRSLILSILGGALGATALRAAEHDLINLLNIIPQNQPINDFPIVPFRKLTKNGGTADLTIDELRIKRWGKEIKVRGYNKQVLPAPIFELPEKGVHKVNIVNKLQEITTVHWHGLDIDTQSDGNPHDPIKPNGGKKLHVLDMKHVRPGTYWYHPHPHGKIAEQIGQGLAGPLVVREQESIFDQPIKEQILFFSEIRFNNKMEAFGGYTDHHDIEFGREDDIILTNGQLTPKLSIKYNSTVRFRLINALGSRYLLMNFGDAQIIQIGSDGGFLEQPREISKIFLCPGERMDVVVHFFGNPGRQFTLKSEFYKRAAIPEFKQKPVPNDLLLVECNETEGRFVNPPRHICTIDPLGDPDAYHQVLMTESDIKPGTEEYNNYMALRNSINSHHQVKGHDHHAMPIPERGFNFSTRFFDINRVDITSTAGQVEEWTIANNTLMDHPFHIHGGQFQVTEHGYQKKIVKPAVREWKDVINVRAGEIIKFKMIQHYKGIKMFHCHISDHEDNGMMGTLKVI